ncbi:cytokinin hydroxylase-like protein, putative [Babesia ovata]|uniref:Cytokinin hydroxylase-like protein, putative n=1 Tax=Babesia ovata TaxID=189622 RepID=A0A2H6KA06_9APIC|nr:cytokinin hydroxylase-like protein, putative [Babesia ovata]GBE59834.1 cytokinin hydroxylase-like protein, putative [Babesia ovata]
MLHLDDSSSMEPLTSRSMASYFDGAIESVTEVLVRCSARMTLRFVDSVTVILGVRKLKLILDHCSFGPADNEEPPMRFKSIAAALELTTAMMRVPFERIMIVAYKKSVFRCSTNLMA